MTKELTKKRKRGKTHPATRTGLPNTFRPGFLSIAKDSGSLVVPVYLGGLWGSLFSYERGKVLWKWPRRWPYPVSIRIGQPITDPTDAEEVRRAVADLGPEG